MTTKSYIASLLKITKNPYASVAEDGLPSSDVTRYIDTGSFIFNALLSTHLTGGIPDNKVIALAGKEATGKTFFSLGICKNFLQDNPNGIVVYFDSEQAITKNMLVERDLDVSRIVHLPTDTVQNFQQQAVAIITDYLKKSEDERRENPMLFVLDSLGNLSTTKEMSDAKEGKEVVDMTRARVIKATFRTLAIMLGTAHIPLIVTNHTYEKVGNMYPEDVMSGGSGLKYNASIVVYLSKRKEKDKEGDVVGNVIHCKLAKGRFSREHRKVDVLLRYDTGLNRHYGLIDLALLGGVFKKDSTRVVVADGTKVFEKTIIENPEKYFTPEVMEKLNEVAKDYFGYGSKIEDELVPDADNDASDSDE